MQCTCSVLSPAACPALQCFSTLSRIRYNFRTKGIEHKMRVLISPAIFVWNISHSKKNWATYFKKMYIGLHVKYPLLLSDFNASWGFSTYTYFRKILKYKILWNSVKWEPSRPMQTEGRTDWQTDGYGDSNSPFSQFCERAWKYPLRRWMHFSLNKRLIRQLHNTGTQIILFNHRHKLWGSRWVGGDKCPSSIFST